MFERAHFFGSSKKNLPFITIHTFILTFFDPLPLALFRLFKYFCPNQRILVRTVSFPWPSCICLHHWAISHCALKWPIAVVSSFNVLQAGAIMSIYQYLQMNGPRVNATAGCVYHKYFSYGDQFCIFTGCRRSIWSDKLQQILLFYQEFMEMGK